MATTPTAMNEGWNALGTGVITFVPHYEQARWCKRADPDPANVPANMVGHPLGLNENYSGDFGTDTVFLYSPSGVDHNASVTV